MFCDHSYKLIEDEAIEEVNPMPAPVAAAQAPTYI